VVDPLHAITRRLFEAWAAANLSAKGLNGFYSRYSRPNLALDFPPWRARVFPLKSFILFASLAVFFATLLCGYGQGTARLTPADLTAFDGAAPELIESWVQAQAAAGTNDYVRAILTLRSMMPRNLSGEQMKAVQNAIGACDAKLMKAANRGDSAALKAVETLRSPGTQLGR